jgi:hypothetical protein
MRRELYPRTYQTYHVPKQFTDARRTLRYEDRLVRVPINTFLKSNPNRIEVDEVNPPELTSTESVPQTVRPEVPPAVEMVIEEETQTEAATPEKAKTFLELLREKLANPQ